MNSLFDFLLAAPAPAAFIRGFLFAGFAAHFLFVLFTLGTAIIGVFYFIRFRLVACPDATLIVKVVLPKFLIHKSLAVVLGISALLLLQICYSLPFFTAIQIMATYWLSIIGLLIVAFLLLDYAAHHLEEMNAVAWTAGFIGLILLLIVPGIFVATLVVMESSGEWLTIIKSGYTINGQLAVHWLFRYLHVIFASLIFTSAYHYLFAQEDETLRRQIMLKWLSGSLLAQFVVGIMLYGTLLGRIDIYSNVAIVLGVSSAAVVLWRIVNGFSLAGKNGVLLFMLILIPMLLTRQVLQDKSVIAVQGEFSKNAENYSPVIAVNQPAALDQYHQDMSYVYDNGQIIYDRSCAFCHGSSANGDGLETKNLVVKPEMISAVRGNRPYFKQVLSNGIDGSGMPYFTVFTGDKLDKLTDYLDERYHVLSTTESIPMSISVADREEAKIVFAATCVSCHGLDGQGNTELSKDYKPSPPNFTIFSLAPNRAMEVITNGYPGTMMSSYRHLPENVRWGLVDVVQEFKRNNEKL